MYLQDTIMPATSGDAYCRLYWQHRVHLEYAAWWCRDADAGSCTHVNLTLDKQLRTELRRHSERTFTCNAGGCYVSDYLGNVRDLERSAQYSVHL